jgi:hypothetical protein
VFNNKSKNEICYFLPEDGKIASAKLFQIFNDFDIRCIYIEAFGFNMNDLLSTILKLDNEKIPVHILADYMQARSPGSWEKLVDFKKSLKYGTITLTTAGVGSDLPSVIFHTKSFSVLFNNKPPLNWSGSVNFSDSGFKQANTVFVFESEVWSGEFINHFNVHKEWALEHIPHKQIDFILENPVTAQEYIETEENSDLIYEIEKLKYFNHLYKISFFVTLFFLIVSLLK